MNQIKLTKEGEKLSRQVYRLWRKLGLSLGGIEDWKYRTYPNSDRYSEHLLREYWGWRARYSLYEFVEDLMYHWEDHYPTLTIKHDECVNDLKTAGLLDQVVIGWKEIY